MELTEVYHRRRQHLLAVASRFVGQDAEDIVQDAFERALRHRDQFRYDAMPSTWLHRIVVNACISQRRNRRRMELNVTHTEHARSVAATGLIEAIALRRALGSLGLVEYRVFVLYEVIGYTHAEIAERLSIPISTSKWRLTRARNQLQSALTTANSKAESNTGTAVRRLSSRL